MHSSFTNTEQNDNIKSAEARYSHVSSSQFAAREANPYDRHTTRRINLGPGSASSFTGRTNLPHQRGVLFADLTLRMRSCVGDDAEVAHMADFCRTESSVDDATP